MGSLAETYNDPAFFAIESRKRAVEYINADDVIVFFLYIRMERRGKGHMLFIGGLTGLLGYQVILRSINVLVFDR